MTGVESVRLVTRADGSTEEVVVVPNRQQVPEQIARVVRTAVVATTGIDPGEAAVRVLPAPAAAPEPAASLAVDPKQPGLTPRPAVVAVSTTVTPDESTVTVHLALDGARQAGTARVGSDVFHAVAQATIEGLRGLLAGLAPTVTHASLVTLGSHPAAAVVLSVPTRRGDQLLCGAALVRRDPNDAMARAVLAALNRWLDI